MIRKQLQGLFLLLIGVVFSGFDIKAFAQCNNIGFETGDFTNWTGTAFNVNTGANIGAFPADDNQEIVPQGVCMVCPPPNQNTTTNGNFDFTIPTLASLAPGGGTFSGRVNNRYWGAKDDRIMNTFAVTAANATITYMFAVVFNDYFDNPAHTTAQLPYFEAVLLDQNGNVIPCSRYYTDPTVFADDNLNLSDGFQKYVDFSNSSIGVNYYWKDWTNVTVDLSAYIGTNVTLRFIAKDCSHPGASHSTHAYVDAVCGPVQKIGHSAASCQGSNVTITAPSGYAGYVWAPGGQTTQAVNVSTSGVYTVTLTTAAGCTKTLTDTVTFFPLPAVMVNPTNANICVGETQTLTASGTNIVSYSWSPSNFLSATTGISVDASPTSNYTYTVTGTDANGCTATAQSAIVVSPLPVVNVPSQNICPGDSAILTASGGATYSWAPNTGLNTTTGATVHGSPAVTTTYTVTVTSIANCTSTATVNINVGNNLNVTASPDVSICSGDNTQLSSTVVAGVTYSWSPPQGLSATNISDPVATPTVTTTYTLTASNGGCTAIDSVKVTVSPVINVPVNSTNVLCNGACNGTATATPTGGLTPLTYNWAPTGGTSSNPSNLCPNTYTVTITDAIGCSKTATTVITEPTPLTLSTTPTPAHCGKPDGSITSNAGGGTVNYTYAWSPTNPTQTTANAANLLPGTYVLTVTDANNCTISSSAIVGNISGITVGVVSQTDAKCKGSCDGTATVGVTTGGTAPFNYSWSNGVLVDNAANLCAQVYTVDVTDATGCVDQVTVTIGEPTPVTLGASADVTICLGQTTALSANASGGTPAYTFTWNPGAITGSPTNVSPITTTTYTVNVTDANGCTTTPANVTVTVNPPLQITPGPGAQFCPGGSAALSASASGGSGVYTYSWMPANLTGSTINVQPNVTTTYTVTVSDDCGTTPATATVQVTIVDPPVILFTSGDTTGCAPLCVKFSDTTPNTTSWSWSFGDNSFSTDKSPEVHCYSNAGTYDVSLSVTDANGCQSTVTHPGMVEVYPLPNAEFSSSPNPTSVLAPVVTFANESQGASTYSWNFGDQSSSTQINPQHAYSPDAPGTYSVVLTVTSNHGCTDEVMHSVVIVPEWSFYVPNTFTPNGDGKNDYFVGVGIGIIEYEMWIYDRWGNEIFETHELFGKWDGKVQGGGSGEVVQEDTYVWLINIKDVFGKKHKYVGHVNVIR